MSNFSREPSELKFTFEERRTVQACAVLVGKPGDRQNYTKLLKLLYLADRQSLIETGRPITGATFVSMANGPVLSEVYNCIREEPSGSFWDNHILKDHYEVVLQADPGDDHLSDYDVGILQALAEKHRNDSYSRMIDIVHTLKEWRHPSPAKVEPLPASRILLLAGEDPRVVEALAKQNEYFASVDAAISSS